MRCSAVLVAAGRGQRFGAPRNKVLLPLGGSTVLAHSLAAFSSVPEIVEIIFVTSEEDEAAVREAVSDAVCAADGIVTSSKAYKFVRGGARRMDSVRAGVHAAGDTDLVAIHDAARPLVTPAIIGNALLAAERSGGAVVAMAAVDTIKRAPDGKFVNLTIPRAEIFQAQTPQVFRRREFIVAIDAAFATGRDFTDDAAVAEHAGIPVEIVAGDPSNIKITWPADLARAEAILRERGKSNIKNKNNSDFNENEFSEPGMFTDARIGMGHDLHRLVPGRPFVLGGVPIPHDRGPLGHSDGDVLLHALADAILGAAGLDDLGTLFPDRDPKYKDADSRKLLAFCVERAHAAGFVISNADCVVIAERPKIAPVRAAIRESIAGILQIDAARVNVKGKTAEGLGPIGAGDAIEANCIVLLRKSRAGGSEE